MRTERLTILVSPEEKGAITTRARELGLSVGETLRLAFVGSGDLTADDVFLRAFVDDAEKTLAQTEARIDAALTSAEAVLAELRASRSPAMAA